MDVLKEASIEELEFFIRTITDVGSGLIHPKFDSLWNTAQVVSFIIK